MRWPGAGLARASDASTAVSSHLMAWSCAVCGGEESTNRFSVPDDASEGGVDPEGFRPSSDRFGVTVARVVTCATCGHGSVAEPPSSSAVRVAYEEAADPVSLREEAGQVETSRRA